MAASGARDRPFYRLGANGGFTSALPLSSSGSVSRLHDAEMRKSCVLTAFLDVLTSGIRVIRSEICGFGDLLCITGLREHRA